MRVQSQGTWPLIGLHHQRHTNSRFVNRCSRDVTRGSFKSGRDERQPAILNKRGAAHTFGAGTRENRKELARFQYSRPALSPASGRFALVPKPLLFWELGTDGIFGPGMMVAAALFANLAKHRPNFIFVVASIIKSLVVCRQG